MAKPTYLLVPRKIVISWIASSLVLFILMLASFQYANYVDRKSNEQWCEVVVLLNEGYKTTPPPTSLGQKIATAMGRLQDKFKCKQ